MKLSDFATLAEAQAYIETRGKMISPDMMLSFITGFGLIGPLIDAPATDLAKSVKAAMTFGSEFNLITGHPQTIIALANGLVAQGTVPQNFIDALVAYANPVYTPFEFATQAEFDLAKLKSVPASVTPCLYGDQDYLVSTFSTDDFVLNGEMALHSEATVSVLWATSVEAQFYKSNVTVQLACDDYAFVSQSFTRNNLGIPKNARIVKFQYLPEYSGAVVFLFASKLV